MLIPSAEAPKFIGLVQKHPIEAVATVLGVGGAIFLGYHAIFNNHWAEPFNTMPARGGERIPGLPEGLSPADVLKNHIDGELKILFAAFPNTTFQLDVDSFEFFPRVGRVNTKTEENPESEDGLKARLLPVKTSSTQLSGEASLLEGSALAWQYEVRFTRYENGLLKHSGRWALTYNSLSTNGIALYCIEELEDGETNKYITTLDIPNTLPVSQPAVIQDTSK
ncbi:hypothetical protein A3C59_02550 [Candidatus Daviesbacteria bacterium RIFCSPHIGHO2_02_FULL_36_13]|uniref:Uncharacterized protein n=1 Tax=Candidatus Daviesbacteria bacterium RIFCSPHIGHO2_02_FULL_36_13 TaxID=1797768 RepID=A0A1F5JMY9_9BACT|nr:MAG: hypothetical protein A3C59_02550 [Candidatus Daviesbacteria bacterium RIFCSPHIGHO2_02_FULL_36_13]